MDENKLKAIVEKVVNKAVDPIKKDLTRVKKDLGSVKKDLTGVKGKLVQIRETQEDHTKRLEALSGDME